MKWMQRALIVAVLPPLFAGTAVGYAQETANATGGETAPARNIQMVGAIASLNKGIDAKKVKQGDAVTAKLQNDVKVPDAVELPKNTVLLGRIDQVQPSENKGDSTVQVTFDKAQLKNGQQLAIKATIMQIAPPPNAMLSQQNASAAGPSAMPSSPAPAAGGGNGPAGGGVQSVQPQPSPNVTSNESDNSTSQSPSLQGVSGVQLQSDIHQQNSGVFTAKKKNVHLDDGTQLQLAIAVIPPNTQLK
jgi:hypothetical protein